jgi:hypothetical protein
LTLLLLIFIVTKVLLVNQGMIWIV